MNGSRRPAFNSKIPWLVVSFVPAVVVATSIFAMVYWGGWNEILVLAIAIWALGAGLVWWVLDAYQDTRPGIWGIGWGFYCAALVTFGVFGYYARQASNESISHEASFSAWMGSRTSRGLDSISVVTLLTWVAIFIIPLVFLYAGPLSLDIANCIREHSIDVTKLLVCRVIAVASTAAVLAAFVRYSSAVLRVILDVDTYLRTGLKEATPRAKIFER